MKTNPNDPINASKHLNGNGHIDTQYTGLTKREYFAAMAMQGYLARCSYITTDTQIDAVQFAVNSADALIQELNKQNNEGI